jgi:hypothetical protein
MLNCKTPNCKTLKQKVELKKRRITNRRMLQKVEKQRLKETKHYKKPKKVENCSTVYRKNPLGLGLG